MINSRKSSSGEEYQYYLKEREILINAKLEGSKLLDKSLLTLSAGAYGISLTLLGLAADSGQSVGLGVLIVTWVFYGISILFTLISIFTSQFACSRQISILEESFEGKGGDSTNCYAIITHILNLISILSFIVGTICLTVFSISSFGN